MSPMKHLLDDILLYVFRIIVRQSESESEEAATRWAIRPDKNRFTLLRLSTVCSRWGGVINENISLSNTVEVRSALVSGRKRDQASGMDKRSMKAAKPLDRKLILYGWCLTEKEYLQNLLGRGPVEWKAIQVLMDEERLDASTWDVEAHSAQEVTIFSPGYSPVRESKEKISFGPVEFTSLLKAATELTNLALDFLVNEDTPASEDVSVLTHRSIQTLSVHLHHFVAGKGPFGVQLRAPSLKTLDLISLRCKSSVDILPFACQWDDPETLSIPTMDDKEVLLAAELTKWLPNVHTTQVMDRNVDAIFAFIHSHLYHIPPISLPLPLPKLSSLFIADTDLREETLSELLENRLRQVRGNAPGVCVITDVTMYNSPAVTPVHWGRVQELLREGINNVEISSGKNIDG